MTIIEQQADRVRAEFKAEIAELIAQCPTSSHYIKRKYGIADSLKVPFETNFLRQPEIQPVIQKALNAEFPI